MAFAPLYASGANSPAFPLPRLNGVFLGREREVRQKLYGLGQEPPGAGDPNWPGWGVDPAAPAGSYVTPEGTLVPPENLDAMRTTAWYDVLGQLQAANSDLQEMEAEIRQHAFDSNWATAARSVNSLRQEYNYMAAQFSDAYRALWGEVPSGLAGLGQEPISITTAGVIAAGVLTGVLALLAIWYVHEAAARDAIALARQDSENQRKLLDAAEAKDREAAAAQAKGDVNEARRLAKEGADLRNQAGIPGKQPDGKPQDLSAWVQKNAWWIVLAGLGVAILPPLIRKVPD